MNRANARVEDLFGAGTWEWDVKSDRLRWSPALSRIYGLPVGEAPHGYLGFLDNVYPDDVELTRHSVERALSEPYDVEYQHRIRRADGEVRVLRSFVHVDRDADGEVVRLSGACQDITERATLQERMRRLQGLASAGTIAAGLSHDLNNVVGALVLLCGSLATGPGAHDPGVLAEIERTAERTALLASRIHKLARTSVTPPPRLDVTAELTRVGRVLQLVLGELVTVDVRVHPDLGEVELDAVDLERVLWNLAINARDAQPRGGLVEIVADRVTVVGQGRAGSYCRISVRDEGAGMDAETVAHLFEPFYTTKGAVGTGLGLAVVHDLIEGAGGFVTVDSQLGAGTRIRAHLPVAERLADGDVCCAGHCTCQRRH